MQSELDSLANVKTTAVANKASKQQQIVRSSSSTFRAELTVSSPRQMKRSELPNPTFPPFPLSKLKSKWSKPR